jgi:hypothetical protein
MLCSAPDGARPHYKFVPSPCHGFDLVAVAARDWADPDSPVSIYIDRRQVARAASAADHAEESAMSAQAYCAAAATAYRMALAAKNASHESTGQAVAALRAANSAASRALQAVDDAHGATLDAADAEHDLERATAAADDATAAADDAAAAVHAARKAAHAAKEAARAAGVDDSDIFELCSLAADAAREHAEHDFSLLRQARMPQWRPTEYVAGRFGGDPRRALRELAEEYLGAHV